MTLLGVDLLSFAVEGMIFLVLSMKGDFVVVVVVFCILDVLFCQQTVILI